MAYIKKLTSSKLIRSKKYRTMVRLHKTSGRPLADILKQHQVTRTLPRFSEARTDLARGYLTARKT